MSTSQIVSSQATGLWFCLILLLPSFVIYLISMVGETNRAPFDLPEAEGELVAGFHTEYSGLRWAMFFLAEYVNMINVSAVATTLFLGGWRMPAPISTWWPGANEGWWPVLWFLGKIMVMLFVFVWLRGTLPRLRYDQFMKFGWRVLIPVSIVWILVIATLKGLRNEYGADLRTSLLWIAAPARRASRPSRSSSTCAAAPTSPSSLPPFDAFAGGHPVPPLPGQEFVVTRRAAATIPAVAVDAAIRRPREGSRRMSDERRFFRGFGVSFTQMFKKVTTEQYPEEKTPTQPRYHGRHQLNRHPDGLEKCVGCELCAWACPADAIFVEGAANTEEERFSPGERYGRVYQINYLRCIFCGLCIEACPTRALTMTNEYELADSSRAALIYEKQDLLGPLLPGMVPAPHQMVPGTTETDYYLGKVTGAVAVQSAEAEARKLGTWTGPQTDEEVTA